MHRAPLLLAVPLALLLALTACGAADPSPSGTASTSASATRTPSPSGTATATPDPSASAPADEEAVDPGPDGPPEPLPSTDPASLDWFGLDQNAVTSSCQTALAEFFPGANVDGVPSASRRDEETVVSFDWIVRAYSGAPDFTSTCVLGVEGGAITSTFITVQDL